MRTTKSGGTEMNYIELAKQVGYPIQHEEWRKATEEFAALVEAAARADERDAIMKSIEELRPVEDNPLLQTKPAAFWIKNFRQIVYARGEV